jgi:hypothetical protein
MFSLQFCDKPFMTQVVGNEMWEKEREDKGNGLLILKLS